MDLFEENLPVIETFKGTCCGVVLYQRAEGDPHICFDILGEDDGNWFLARNGASTCWLYDLQIQMGLAMNYLQTDTAIEPYEWGFRLKDA